MAARGYREVVSYAFVDEQWELDFAANANPIRLQAIMAQYAVMRSTLIGGLVEILQNNLNRKQTACACLKSPACSAKVQTAGWC